MKKENRKPISMKSSKQLRAEVKRGGSRSVKALNELARREKIKQNA